LLPCHRISFTTLVSVGVSLPRLPLGVVSCPVLEGGVSLPPTTATAVMLYMVPGRRRLAPHSIVGQVAVTHGPMDLLGGQRVTMYELTEAPGARFSGGLSVMLPPVGLMG